MKFKQEILVLLGAIIGGMLGYFVFFWILLQGFYELILPGGLVGLGAGLFKSKLKIVSAICGLLALTFGIVAEWRFAPFKADDSFGYFVTQLHQLKPMTLIMIVAGTAVGFWIPFRRSQEPETA